MAVALDTETEIAATMTSSEACSTYYREGLSEAHFADPGCRNVFKWCMDYYMTHGRMVEAPSADIIVTEFPDYMETIDGAKGAAPSYLAKRLKGEYIKRQVNEGAKTFLPMMNDDSLAAAVMFRETLSNIVDACTTTDEILEYGKDMEAYRRKLAAIREHTGAPYPFKEMQAHTGGIHDGEMAVFVGPSGMGKAQPLDSKILTDSGWVCMGDLSLGDMVKTRSGGSARVTGIFPKGSLDVYQVTFADGRRMLCNDGHLFTVVYKGKDKGKTAYKEKVVSVREMLDAGIRNNWGGYKWMVPASEPMNFPKVEHVIDPYVLGVLIGDGHLTGTGLTFSQNEPDIVQRVSNILGEDYSVRKRQGDNYSYGIKALRYLTVNHLHRHPLKLEIERLGLNVKSPQRFIPDEYMWDSASNRMALLEGLFDTDGSVLPNGHFVYSTRSKQLALDVQSLARSLGYGSTISYNDRADKGVDINVSIITNDRIFRSDKHNRRFDEHCSSRKLFHSSRMSIVDIKSLGYKTEMQCIMIDDPDHMYITDEYCLTHNTLFACKAALEAIRAGRNVYFASLELTIETITQRLEYMVVNEDGLKVPIVDYTSGRVLPEYELEIRKAQDKIVAMDGTLIVAQPPVENRSPSALVQACKAHGCNFLIVDQLQFVTRPKRDSLQESYGAALQEFKQQIMTPVDNIRLPLLLLHQMNRGGAKTQREGIGKVGSMTDIAGSAWVEQISDIVWGIGRNDEERNNDIMNLATLKTRNVAPVGWQLSWDPNITYQFDILRDENGNARRLDRW